MFTIKTALALLYMSTNSTKQTVCIADSKERIIAEVYADILSDKKPDDKINSEGFSEWCSTISINGFLEFIHFTTFLKELN
jgi:hypothetical protein